MAIHLHQSDLPDRLTLGPVVAIDTETMGLDPRRDRLCVVQLSDGAGDAHLVQIAKGQTRAPNLERLLADPATLKLFHYGRFDIAVMKKAFGVTTAPVDVRPATPSWFVYDNVNDPTPEPEPCATMNARSPLPSV